MPTPTSLNIQFKAWDATFFTNFNMALGGPLGLVMPGPFSSSLVLADYPATIYAQCIAVWGTGASSDRLAFSDGANWYRVPIQAAAQANSTGWTDSVAEAQFNLLLTALRGCFAIGGTGTGPGITGTRPAWSVITSTLDSWDSIVADNFNMIFATPSPIFQQPLATLNSLWPASSWPDCLAVAYDYDCLVFSNGTAWNPIPFQSAYSQTASPGSGWADATALADFQNLLTVLVNSSAIRP